MWRGVLCALRDGAELDIPEDRAALLIGMSPERAKMLARRRSHTKPGSLLKDAIPIRTWAQWDDTVPGFLEIDLVGHEAATRSVGTRTADGDGYRHRLDREPVGA